jgi:hypothetical protein
MRIQDDNMRSDPGRRAIDHHAVTAAGQLLMSAIWLEHRVRSFSTHLNLLASPRFSDAPATSSSDSHQSERGQLVSEGWSDWPTPTKRKAGLNDTVREAWLRDQAGGRF